MSFVEKYGKKAATNRTADALQKKPTQPPIEKKAENKLDSKKSSKADLVYLVKGIDDNKNAWYYVLVERLKVSLFLKALNDDIIHLENYGIILYSAYGDHPPEDITAKLKDEYGIDG